MANGSTRIVTSAQISSGLIASYKNAPTACTSSTTLASDSSLIITINNNGWYGFEIFLPVNATSNGFGGFQFDLGANTAILANVIYNVTGYSNAAITFAAPLLSNTACTSVSNIAVATATSYFRASGVLTVTTIGNLGVRWSQNTSSANATNLLGGAYFFVTPL